MKVGILGGTFNPIHVGHLLIAQDAMEQTGLDRVKFIPSATPPHKQGDGLASAIHRLRMIKLAIRGNDRFEVDDIEIKRGGKSYSVETLTELKRRQARAQFYFIIGSDSLQELHLWKNVSRLVQLCTFITLARPGFEMRHELVARLPSSAIAGIERHIVSGHVCEVASREIRSRVARGQPFRYLVPDAVHNYIRKHRLYL